MQSLQSAQKDQIVDVRAGGTSLQQIAERLKKWIRVIAGQVTRDVQPERRGSLGGFAGRDRTGRISGTVVSIRG